MSSPSSAHPEHARPHLSTLTKIIATLGPASERPEIVRDLIAAGVHVFRFNFSHGTLDQHAARLEVVRDQAARAGQPVAVLGDLQGPKIRVGVIDGPGIMLEAGREVVIVDPGVDIAAVREATQAACIPGGVPGLAAQVRPGERVLINDGAVRLTAMEPGPRDGGGGLLRCRVEFGGLVTSKKGINLPDSALAISPITEHDWRCVEWSVARGIDLLALSFVRSGAEVVELKTALAGMCGVERARSGGKASFIPVIAKIEKPQAVERIDEILEAADGIMVARGDLGVEMDLAEVPLVQRRLLAKADEWGKPCIVATQMLESMTTAAAPTRAEAGDVSTAVWNGEHGADAVMLSGETAAGVHPVLAVGAMRRIVGTTEEFLRARGNEASPSSRLVKSRYRTAALAHGAFHVARDVGASVVVCWSQEGGTARYLSQTGLNIPIIAYSDDWAQVRRMALLRAVTPRLMAVPNPCTLEAFYAAVDADLLERRWAQRGERMVVVAGLPLGVRGSTTGLVVRAVGEA